MELLRELDPSEALEVLEENGYFTPHLLVKNDSKRALRSGFFEFLFKRTRIFQVNTVNAPEESQKILKRAISGEI